MFFKTISNQKQSSGLISIVCLVPLGCSSRLKKAPFHRPLEPKIRAAKKNSSSFFVFYVPSLHTRSQYIRQGYQSKIQLHSVSLHSAVLLSFALYFFSGCSYD
nr:hypothetical protein [uncultured Flavobacterium sp.]